VGRASSQKKVARAATTGGGRTPGASQSFGWYATLGIVLLLGIFLVAFSRNEELNRGQAAAAKTATPPKLDSDSWHSSFGVYICDHWAPSVPLFETADGITTLGDGVINIRPYTPKASGSNATLSVFVNAASKIGDGTFKLTSSELKYLAVPGDTNPLDSKDWHNGDKCPDGKSGRVQFTVNGKVQKGNPTSWRLRDGDYLDVGFVPSGQTLPSNPNEKKALSSTPTGTPATATPTTTVPTTPTTKPGATSVTVTPATPTTAAPTPTTAAPTPATPTTAAPTTVTPTTA
jgi:hypothetical protein